MKHPFKMLRTLITYLCWGVVGVLFTLTAFPFVLLPARVRYDNRLYYALCAWWVRVGFVLGGIKVTVSGAEKLPSYPQQPSIFVMNHASAIDILVIERLLKSYPRVWISRVAYRSVPVLRTVMSRMHVIVDLTSSRAAVRALSRMIELGRNAVRHLLIFPEGGRFTDGKIRDFFRGYVVMARKLKRPIVPIYIGNGAEIFHPEGYIINNNYPLTLEIGEPFILGDDETDEAFNQRVRAWFVQREKSA